MILTRTRISSCLGFRGICGISYTWLWIISRCRSWDSSTITMQFLRYSMTSVRVMDHISASWDRTSRSEPSEPCSFINIHLTVRRSLSSSVDACVSGYSSLFALLISYMHFLSHCTSAALASSTSAISGCGKAIPDAFPKPSSSKPIPLPGSDRNYRIHLPASMTRTNTYRSISPSAPPPGTQPNKTAYPNSPVRNPT